MTHFSCVYVDLYKLYNCGLYVDCVSVFFSCGINIYFCVDFLYFPHSIYVDYGSSIWIQCECQEHVFDWLDLVVVAAIIVQKLTHNRNHAHFNSAWQFYIASTENSLTVLACLMMHQPSLPVV